MKREALVLLVTVAPWVWLMACTDSVAEPSEDSASLALDDLGSSGDVVEVSVGLDLIVADAGSGDSLEAPDAVEDTGPCPAAMVLIAAGEFAFGPGPLATVLAEDYCVDLFEVSAGEFNACVAADACEGHAAWPMCEELDEEVSPNQCFADRGEFAANYLDWYRAHAYCAWMGKRLPTPQQWERAARGDHGFTYPWGEDDLDCERAHQGRGAIFDACLHYGGLPNRPIEVGSYVTGISPYGLFDTLGNVKEWVDIRDDPSRMPVDSDKARSRGGDFYEGEWLMTVLAYDGQLGPGLSSQGHGVRCVADPVSAP